MVAGLGLAVGTPLTLHYATAASGILPQRGHVAVPSADAGPRRVVATFVRALDLHDAATARALISPSSRLMADVTTMYLERLDRVATYRVGRVSHEPLSPEYDVGLIWDLRWAHPDYLHTDGRQFWGFALRRQLRTGRWLITGQGVG